MRKRTGGSHTKARWTLLALCVALAGCGGVQPIRQSRSTGMGSNLGAAGTLGTPSPGVLGGHRAGPGGVTTEEGDYYGRPCLKLSNGLVTVVVVPDLGGRVMEYKLGGHPFLWVNVPQISAFDESAGAGTWQNWGGYKVWPAPQDQWNGPPDPEGSQLDSGKYTGAFGPADNGAQAIVVESPPDPDVTGLKYRRVVKCYPGTSRVTVEQTMTNVGKQPVTWSLWDVTQVPGALEQDTKFSREARIYFPLAEKSRFDHGFTTLLNGGDAQWKPDADTGIMMVEYQGVQGKIGADSTAGWVAYVDDKHDYTYVKRFSVDANAEYPDGGCTVEVFTSGDLPYMEVEVLSPLVTLQPGESSTFTEDWYAARCPGPIVDCTEVGAISVPVKARSSGKDVRVTGKLGVFTPGQLQLVLVGRDGRVLKTQAGPKVSPEEVVTLDQKLPLPDGCEEVRVALLGSDNAPAGRLAVATVQQARNEMAEGTR